MAEPRPSQWEFSKTDPAQAGKQAAGFLKAYYDSGDKRAREAVLASLELWAGRKSKPRDTHIFLDKLSVTRDKDPGLKQAVGYYKTKTNNATFAGLLDFIKSQRSAAWSSQKKGPQIDMRLVESALSGNETAIKALLGHESELNAFLKAGGNDRNVAESMLAKIQDQMIAKQSLDSAEFRKSGLAEKLALVQEFLRQEIKKRNAYGIEYMKLVGQLPAAGAVDATMVLAAALWKRRETNPDAKEIKADERRDASLVPKRQAPRKEIREETWLASMLANCVNAAKEDTQAIWSLNELYKNREKLKQYMNANEMRAVAFLFNTAMANEKSFGPAYSFSRHLSEVRDPALKPLKEYLAKNKGKLDDDIGFEIAGIAKLALRSYLVTNRNSSLFVEMGNLPQESGSMKITRTTLTPNDAIRLALLARRASLLKNGNIDILITRWEAPGKEAQKKPVEAQKEMRVPGWP